MKFLRKYYLDVHVLLLFFLLPIFNFILGINIWLGLLITLILNFISVIGAYNVYTTINAVLKIIIMYCFLWIINLGYSIEITMNSIFAYLALFFNFILVISLYYLIKGKIKHWTIYFVIFISSIVIYSVFFMFGIIIFQSTLGVSDKLVLIFLYTLVIMTPVIFILFENDLKQLAEIKVSIYAWIAAFTLVSSLSFLYQFNIQQLLMGFDEKEEISVDLIIKIIFLPHVLGTSIGAFFVEWKEKKLKYKND